MKIVFVIGLYPYQIGGAEMQAREISLALKQEGHSIYYLCYTSKLYDSDEFNVTIIPNRSKFDLLYYGTKKKIYAALEHINPDVVYHRAFTPYSRFVAKWCYSHKIPFYFHCADIYTLIRKNNSIYNIIQNSWLNYTLRHATGVICQNSEQFQALQKFKLSKLKKIYNLQRKNIRALNTKKSIEIVWIGKFEPAKQPEIFVSFAEQFVECEVMFTMFSSKMPDTKINKVLKKRIDKNSHIKLIEGKDN